MDGRPPTCGPTATTLVHETNLLRTRAKSTASPERAINRIARGGVGTAGLICTGHVPRLTISVRQVGCRRHLCGARQRAPLPLRENQMSVQATTMDDVAVRSRPMSREEKRV